MNIQDLIFLVVVLTGPVDMGGKQEQVIAMPFPDYISCSKAKVALDTKKDVRASLDAMLREQLGEGLQAVRGCFNYDDAVEETESGAN